MATIHSDSPPSNQSELLAGLLAQQQQAQQAQQPTQRRRKAGSSTYEVIIGKVALAIALILVVGLWSVGGYFTLAWIDSLGVPITQLGLVAWVVPIFVSILEVGIVMIRARTPWAWLAWVLVLGFDAYSTAAGGLTFATAQGWMSNADLTLWAVAGLIGLGIALAPEPAGRAIVRELQS